MPILYIVCGLIIVGVLMWIVNSYIPMASGIKSLLNAVVVIAMVVWVLRASGWWDTLLQYRVPH
jgi:hypothetical protein